MEWTMEDKEALQSFKNAIDSDDIKVKEQIKKVLLNSRFIIHVLNNKELEESDAEPDDYFGINILPYILVTPTQTNVQNFICYEVNYDTLSQYNKSIKLLNITFYILCEQKNIIDKDTGIAKHDLLASLIQYEFNFTNYIGGGKIELVSDTSSVVDSNYATRTLVFRQMTDNNLVKTRNGVPKLANKEIHTLG